MSFGSRFVLGIKTDLFGTLWPPQVRPARPAHHRRTRGRILGQLGSPVDALRRASTSKLHRKLRWVEVQCGSEGRRRAGETVRTAAPTDRMAQGMPRGAYTCPWGVADGARGPLLVTTETGASRAGFARGRRRQDHRVSGDPCKLSMILDRMTKANA